jgi:hypothetical protein
MPVVVTYVAISALSAFGPIARAGARAGQRRALPGVVASCSALFWQVGFGDLGILQEIGRGRFDPAEFRSVSRAAIPAVLLLGALRARFLRPRL